MRAPPLAEKHTSGISRSRQTLAARTKRSPTTEPMEPPMKPNSKAQATSGVPLSAPATATSASVSPVATRDSLRRSLYFLVSLNLSTSSGAILAPISSFGVESRNSSRRRRAPTRMWCVHLGQTFWLFSISALYSTAPQAGHFFHSPSGTVTFWLRPGS